MYGIKYTLSLGAHGSSLINDFVTQIWPIRTKCVLFIEVSLFQGVLIIGVPLCA